MPTLDEALDAAVAAARRAKERQARKADPDVGSMLLAYRGVDLVAMIQPERINRDDTLKAARLAAIGYSADLLATVVESYQTTLTVNPVTGKKWGPREQQDVAEHHDGLAQGWVTETLWVSAYNRAGDCRVRWLPYRVAAHRLTWLPEQRGEDGTWSGLIYDAMTAIMTEPSLDVRAAQVGLNAADFGLSAEEALAQMDVVTTRILIGEKFTPGAPRCSVALAATPNTVRERLIRKMMPGGRVIRP